MEAEERPSAAPSSNELQEKSLPVALLRTREAVMSRMRPILRSHGFTEQQWRVLRSLDTQVPVDKTKLADRSALLMPSLLRILKDLQEAGYISSITDPANSRLVRVKLTKKGAGAVSATTADILAMTSVIRTHLGEEMLEDLIARLNYVERRLCQLQESMPAGGFRPG